MNKTYQVEIEFNSEICGENLTKYLSSKMGNKKILKRDENHLIMLVPVPPEEGLGELENTLYYFLDGGRLGFCSSYKIFEGL